MIQVFGKMLVVNARQNGTWQMRHQQQHQQSQLTLRVNVTPKSSSALDGADSVAGRRSR